MIYITKWTLFHKEQNFLARYIQRALFFSVAVGSRIHSFLNHSDAWKVGNNLRSFTV